MVFWLAIFGMVCWGIAPVFAKIGLNNVNPLSGLVFRTLLAATMIVSWVGISGSIREIKNIPFNACILIALEAILATLVGDLAYYAAIKNGDVSIVTIIMASSPLVTMICATLFLGEQITLIKIMGACFVILGIILIV